MESCDEMTKRHQEDEIEFILALHKIPKESVSKSYDHEPLSRTILLQVSKFKLPNWERDTKARQILLT